MLFVASVVAMVVFNLSFSNESYFVADESLWASSAGFEVPVDVVADVKEGTSNNDNDSGIGIRSVLEEPVVDEDDESMGSWEVVTDDGSKVESESDRQNNPDSTLSRTSTTALDSDGKQHDQSVDNHDNHAGTDDSDMGKHELPLWIREYLAWHKEILVRYPQKELMRHPDAPGLLIRTCVPKLDNVHNQLGQLPWDLYLANQTRRVYFIRWIPPCRLDEFVVPADVQWRLPFRTSRRVLRNQRNLFEGYDVDETNPVEALSNWTLVDDVIARARWNGQNNSRVLEQRVLGHKAESALEMRLRSGGETDMIHHTASFGKLFRAFFRPSGSVQEEMDRIFGGTNVTVGSYSVVHCAVKRPLEEPESAPVLYRPSLPDRVGFEWEDGLTRNYAVDVATRALLCSREWGNVSLSENEEDRSGTGSAVAAATAVVAARSGSSDEALYFASDSDRLLRYVGGECMESICCVVEPI